ncbi:MarR family transcriptional regulator [Bacillus manliponensis]|uniref:MarR family transcriptional regulator n=1 Tax=Bacillus manliponensis TaxID=574376 RepID=A0A073KA88_9BACI|nr:DUF2892 domain-containing protein [Bacillus manliponensis]KEK19218.1 MarR family transcriptional regulator [Bacillus manliponensis]
MKQNIGTVNALIRITIGFVLFGCSTAKLVRKPWCTWSQIMLWIGAMKIAEGIIRFCPIVEVFKISKYMNFMNMSDMKMPSMDFMKEGHSNTDEAKQTSKHDEATTKGSYDASDKAIESEIEKALMTDVL